ncbi:Acidic amino acid decarboxylase GADL1 [Varanus komodoensis]|nr:Acidic amino acid decarboxylase GADL1 [Varanus komodoensis]
MKLGMYIQKVELRFERSILSPAISGFWGQGWGEIIPVTCFPVLPVAGLMHSHLCLECASCFPLRLSLMISPRVIVCLIYSFTSLAFIQCHYSVKKAASFLGIGTQNVYFIKSDERGKMIPEELEKQVQRARKEGSAPFFVSATSGTTVLGAFDPLDEIANICEKYDLWLHVDASWGGSALLSRKHRKLLHGIHRANSVAWNPHKMLMAGIQCCALLVKDNSQDKFYDVSYDTGDKSIQCSRRADAFKFWMTWKALGTTGLEERVNRALALARYCLPIIKIFTCL